MKRNKNTGLFENVTLQRKRALGAGFLIIIGMIAGMLSISPSVDSSNYLTTVSDQQNQLRTAALFQFLLVPTYIGFALILFPLLRKYNESLSLGFLSFRIIAGVFQIIALLILPLFILLSQHFLNSTIPNPSFYPIIGELLQHFRDLSNHVGVMLATGIGNLFLYYIFYKTKWIPRWLSLWGLLANILAMLASIFILFSLIDVISSYFVLLSIPIVLEEITLAAWLIFRGFNISIINKTRIKNKII